MTSSCGVLKCKKDLTSFHSSRPRTDGAMVQVLNTGRCYLLCNECATEIGLM